MSSAELGRRVILTPQGVGPLPARLERDGLVDREQVGGPGTAIITRNGRDRLVRATALVQDLEDELVAMMDPAQRGVPDQQLWELLRRLGPPDAADGPART